MAVVNDPEDVDGDFSVSTVNFRQGDEGTIAYVSFVDPKAQGGKGTKAKSGKGSDKVFDAGAAID